MKSFFSERLFFFIALALYGLHVFLVGKGSGWKIPWTSYPLFLPTGLMFLCAANHWVRSKALGWGIFTFAFIFFMTVFGSMVMGLRLTSAAGSWDFARALSLYAGAGVVGLFQLRSPTAVK